MEYILNSSDNANIMNTKIVKMIQKLSRNFPHSPRVFMKELLQYSTTLEIMQVHPPEFCLYIHYLHSQHVL